MTTKPTKIHTGKHQEGKKLGKRRERLNRRQTAWSATVKGIKNPAAYRMPGSMKGM
jgi:hypothetical protein